MDRWLGLLPVEVPGVIFHLSHGLSISPKLEDYGLMTHCIHLAPHLLQKDGQQEDWEGGFKGPDLLGLT